MSAQNIAKNTEAVVTENAEEPLSPELSEALEEVRKRWNVELDEDDPLLPLYALLFGIEKRLEELSDPKSSPLVKALEEGVKVKTTVALKKEDVASAFQGFSELLKEELSRLERSEDRIDLTSGKNSNAEAKAPLYGLSLLKDGAFLLLAIAVAVVAGGSLGTLAALLILGE